MGGRRAASFVVVVAAVIASCGDPQPPNDGGPDGQVAIEPPSPPTPPALPSLTPCPSGWIEREPLGAGSATTCDPFPEGGPLWCPSEDEAHFPGEIECTLIGTACPDGDWPEIPDEGYRKLFVRAGEPEGGDGTEAFPFGTIAEAMAQAEEGTVIALSRGTYDEEVQLRSGVTIWGACVAETTLTTSEPHEELGAVEVRGMDTVLRNVRISGQRVGVGVHGAMASLALEDVLIEGVVKYGVVVDGGHLIGRNVVVRETTGNTSGELGIGLWVGDGAVVVLERVVLDGNQFLGASAFGDGTLLQLSDLCVLNTQAQEVDGMGGSALLIGGGAEAELTRAVLDENRDVGLWVYGDDTEVLLADAILRETLSRESDGLFGVGMELSDGAHVDVRRVLFDQNRETGVWAYGQGTGVELTDSIIRDTRERDQGGQYGQGLVVEDGARADVTRTLLEGNSSGGASGIGNETRLVLTDLIVRVTRGQDSDGRFGTGLLVSEGARADVLRALFERNTTEGVRATRFGTVLNLSDTVIRSTRSQQVDGLYGIGLVVAGQAEVDVSRAVIDGNRYAGIVAFGQGTTLSIEDLSVMNTNGQERDGFGGRGLEVSYGAEVEVHRAVLEMNHDVGAVAFGEDTSLVLSDVRVQETMSQASGGGIGLASLDGAHVDLSHLRSSENDLCGVMIGHGRDLESGLRFTLGGTLTAEEVEVRGHAVGLNVQTDAVDLELIVEQLLFFGNDIDVDSSALPEPALGPPLGND